MTAKHKEGCWYPRVQERERHYHETYPNACERCEGWGGASFYERDTGYQGYDPCPECLEKGKCPRCAEGVIAEAYWDAGLVANCDNCGFIEGTSQGWWYVDEPCSCIEPWPGWPDGDYFADHDADQFARERGDADEPYPYELSDHLYDAWRERGRR